MEEEQKKDELTEEQKEKLKELTANYWSAADEAARTLGFSSGREYLSWRRRQGGGCSH